MPKITNYNIHDRVYAWVVKVLKLIDHIPKNTKNNVIIYQLTKATTSTGANDQEADGASSKKDFIFKYELTRREAKEANYWLKLIKDTLPKLAPETQPLIIEGEELIKIFSSIISKSKRKKE